MIEIRSFQIFSKELGFIVLPEFATSTSVFCEVIGTSVNALKKMSYLEIVALSSLMLCRSKNAEKKRKLELTSLLTCNIINNTMKIRKLNETYL